MLPMTLLQTSELSIFDTELSSSNLLPEEALQPSATFSEALQLGLDVVDTASELHGMGLPPNGKPLPDPETVELELALQHDAVEAAVPVLQPSRTELPVRAIAVTAQAATNLPPGTATPVTPPLVQTPLQQVELAPAQTRPAAQPVGAQLEAAPVLDNAIRAQRNAVEVPRQPTTIAPEPMIGQVARELSSGSAIAAVIPAALKEALAPEQKPGARLNLSQELPRAAAAAPTALTTIADDLAAEPRTPLKTNTAPAAQPAIAAAQTTQAPTVQAEVTTTQPLQFSAVQAGQQSSQPAAEASPAAPQLNQTIGTPVRDAAWGESIGERVLVMASNKLQSAEIRLTPAELGPLRVQVSVDDKAANITFLAQHAVTREALEQAMPRLRELLAENGLTLNQSSIGEHSKQGVQHGGRDSDSGRSNQTAGAAVDAGVDTAGDDTPSSAAMRKRPDSLVDTFA